MDVGTLPNYVNLCLDFLLLSLFHFILFIIVVRDNNSLIIEILFYCIKTYTVAGH
jgi:hypothetical protein